MDDITTADELPPPVAHRSRLYDDDFQKRLKDNLGTWHRAEKGRERRPSYYWAKQRFPGLEVATRTSADGTFETWARYPAP